MKKLLILNASAKKEGSLSRLLTSIFKNKWLAKWPDDQIDCRDISDASIPHLTDLWITAAQKPKALRSPQEDEELLWSDMLVDELLAVDVIVLGTPMYNWSVPSALKAYIDQIVRVNRTILLDESDIENPVKGLLQNKQVYLCLTRGAVGYKIGEKFASIDFQSNYLKTIFNMMGIDAVEQIVIDGTSHGVDNVDQQLNAAAARIETILNQLSKY